MEFAAFTVNKYILEFAILAIYQMEVKICSVTNSCIEKFVKTLLRFSPQNRGVSKEKVELYHQRKGKKNCI